MNLGRQKLQTIAERMSSIAKHLWEVNYELQAIGYSFYEAIISSLWKTVLLKMHGLQSWKGECGQKKQRDADIVTNWYDAHIHY